MPPSDTFQHYQLLRREDGKLWELGRGTMGVTYKALDTSLHCPVALKVVNGMFLHDEAARARFLREARAAAALRHRNVASVYHLCGDGEHFFYAMEFIDGETVETWVRRSGPLPVATTLDVALQTTRALGAAARQRLVHRDVKPANLMVVHEDADEQFLVKLIDFGLARSFRSGDTTSPPAAASVAGFHGTPAFASPEQLNEAELDARSDIYSLGVTLWFMLAGEPPFAGNLAVLYQRHLHEQPPWERLAGTPEPVLTLLRHMLEKDPDRRPQSASELRERLTDCLRAVAVSNPGVAATDAGALDLTADLDPSTAVHAPDLPEPTPGMRLAGGLRLGRLIGEGNHGLTFQANDPRQDRRPLAVKVFHPEALNDARFQALSERVGRLRAAPHPNLLEVFTLERHRHLTYATLEWVEGFTLTGLLRKRGTLTVIECLCLLQQVAAAADHARAHGLTGLELAPHQIIVHFPSDPQTGGLDREALLRDPVTAWPEFALKVDALHDARAGSTLATWSGELTVVPDPAGALRTAADHLGGSARNGSPDLRALGILVYELLGGSGAPPLLRIGTVAAVAGGERDQSPPPLPILGGAGNAVLRGCLSGESGFRGEGEFFTAFARASGFNPADLGQTSRARSVAIAGPALVPSTRPLAPRAAVVPSVVPVGGGKPSHPDDAETRGPATGGLATAARRPRPSTPTPARMGAKPYSRLASAFPVGSPRRRRWAVALAGFALILALTNVAWWVLDVGGSAPAASPPSVQPPPAAAAAPQDPPVPVVPVPESVPLASPPQLTPSEVPDATDSPQPSTSPAAPALIPPVVPPEPASGEIGEGTTPAADPPNDGPARPGPAPADAGVPPVGGAAADQPLTPNIVLPAGPPGGPPPPQGRDATPFAAVESSPEGRGDDVVPKVKRSPTRPGMTSRSHARSHRRQRRMRRPNLLERLFGGWSR